MAENPIGGLLGGSALGTLYVVLTAQSTELVKGMQEAEDSVTSGSAAMLKQGSLLAAGLTAAFVVIGAKSIEEFAKFDKALTSSFAVMGQLSEETKKRMAEVAESLSGKTTQSAIELAGAYKNLARSGMDAEQAMAALPEVTKFATAGQIDLSTATTLLTDAQAALGLKSKDAGENLANMNRLADALSKTSLIANADISQFAEAIGGKAGAALRSTNKDLEEGLAVLADFAAQGIKGGEAGQELAQILNLLQKQAISNKQVFQELGISVFDAQGKMNKFSDILKQFERALSGASTEQRRMVLEMLGFQSRTLTVVQSLIGTSDQVKEYEDAIRKAGGATEEIANTTLTSFSAQLAITDNLIKGLFTSIGRELAPAILSLNAALKDMLQHTADADGSFAVVVGTVKGLVLVVSVAGIAFYDLGKAIGEATNLGLDNFNTALDTTKKLSIDFTNVLVDEINLLLDFMKTTSTMVEVAGSLATGHLGTARDLIKGQFDDIKNDVKNFSQDIKNSVSDALNGVAKTSQNTLDASASFSLDILTQWTSVSKMFDGLFKTTTKSSGDMLGIFKNIESTSLELANDIAKAFQKTAQSVDESIKGVNKSLEIIDSTKVNELLKLLGTPPGTGAGGKVPSASDLLGGINVGNTTDSTKAAEMLKAAGIESGGGRGNQTALDPLSSQAELIHREIQMNKDKLKILNDLGNQELKLNADVEKKKLDAITAYNLKMKQLQTAQAQIVVNAGQQMFDALGTAIAGFAGKQSAAYKTMFAISKAFAIADAVIKIQQGVANALSLPYPANLVAAASVVAAAASIVTTISSVKLEFDGQKAAGGPVEAGKLYLVGERGPEAFSPSSNGTIIPNDRLGGGSGVKVVVNNYTDATATVSESKDSDGKTLSIIIKRLKSEIGSEIRDGRGDINRSMESTWGLRRNK